MTERVKILAWKELGTNAFALMAEWVTNVRTGPVSSKKSRLTFLNFVNRARRCLFRSCRS